MRIAEQTPFFAKNSLLIATSGLQIEQKAPAHSLSQVKHAVN